MMMVEFMEDGEENDNDDNDDNDGRMDDANYRIWVT